MLGGKEQIPKEVVSTSFNFKTLAEAKAKAAEILEELNKNGLEGLNFDSELRYMAMKAKSLLDPLVRTLDDAVQLYLEHPKLETAAG